MIYEQTPNSVLAKAQAEWLDAQDGSEDTHEADVMLEIKLVRFGAITPDESIEAFDILHTPRGATIEVTFEGVPMQYHLHPDGSFCRA